MPRGIGEDGCDAELGSGSENKSVSSHDLCASRFVGTTYHISISCQLICSSSMVGAEGVEPSTSAMSQQRSTAELRARAFGGVGANRTPVFRVQTGGSPN